MPLSCPNACASRVSFTHSNGQRPEVITGIKMKEYENSSELTPGTSLIMVEEHKESRPASVITSGDSCVGNEGLGQLPPAILGTRRESMYTFALKMARN